MIQIDEIVIRNLTLHRVASEGGKSIVGDVSLDYKGEDEEKVLKRIFLRPFLSVMETFEFSHDIDLNYNVLYNLAKNIYEGNSFVSESEKIVQHLMLSSKHPNIKDGDLFIVKFDDVKYEGRFLEAIGIYKFEDKDSFIETKINGNSMALDFRQGIGGRKPDKACLILFSERPYTIFIVENGAADTGYWHNEFINRRLKNDDVNSTSNFLGLTRKFITNEVSSFPEVSKADRIDLLNRSVEYFKTHNHFDKNEFEEQVFAGSNLVDSFREFDQSYRKENAVQIKDKFDISVQAVKKQTKVFKSVLKLDGNFDVYIHGDRRYIERGIEEDGRKFYKLYYEEER